MRSAVAEWNSTQSPFPDACCVHAAFEAIAGNFPQRDALRFETETISYGELNRRANLLASSLLVQGVQPDQPVGVCIERNLHMIVALLAILKAGGAYLPVDCSHPPARNTAILEQARVRLVLCPEHLRSALGTWHGMCIDPTTPDGKPEAANPPNPCTKAAAANLCYVLFTSGSTGKPKAVAVEHRAVMRLIKNTNFAVLDAGQTWMVLSPLAFDLSTLEIWAPLCNGGCAALVPPGPLCLEAIGKTIRERNVTSAWLTSGLFRLIVGERIGYLAPLRQLIVGGDVVPAAECRMVLERYPDMRLVNGYGPTENTTFSTFHRIRLADCERSSIPIGRPIANSTVHILDPALNLCEVGTAGEIFVGGEGLARGYLHDPDATAQKFIEHPEWGRIYATGDLGRWLPDGSVEFLGRIDEQVKVRGFRIEPGEIETALLAFTGVRQAVVVAMEPSPGEKQLAGFVAPEKVNLAALKEFLGVRLPPHLLPAILKAVPSFPVTSNGKVDRAALAVLVEPRTPTREPAPATSSHSPEVSAILNIWRQVLGRSDVDPEDSFFELGGDSLRLANVHARLESLAGRSLPVGEMFAHPTVRSQAEWVAGISNPAKDSQAERAAMRRNAARRKRESFQAS